MVYLIIGFAVWPKKPLNEQSFFASFFSKKEVLSYSLLCGLGMALLAGPAAAQKRSGYDDAGPQTRAMQDDDSANPGFLWVVQGEALWAAPAAADGKSCADCHGGIAAMRGVAARYPSHDAARDRPLNLTARVNICRTEHQGAPPLGVESQAMLALTAAIGRQSRGMALHIDATGPLAPVIARGALLFRPGRGSSICPARSAMTIALGGGWAGRSFRKAMPMAIRNIGWNGRHSARSRGGCGPA